MKLYDVFDIKAPLLEQNVISASNARRAIESYLKGKGEAAKIKRSGTFSPRFCAVECIMENGRVVRLGWKRKIWFDVVD